MKTVLLDAYTLAGCTPGWKDRLAHLGPLTVYSHTAPAQTIGRIGDAEAVLTNKVPITAEVMAACPSLRYIGVLATGVNVVDIEAAHRAGITVTNIPAYSTMSVAQMVFALLLAHTNRVEHYTALNREGWWSRCGGFTWSDTPLTELAGRSIGIVGLGHIGMAVARIARAFGMHVAAYTSKPADALPEGIAKADSLDSLFSQSQVVTLHCPLTPDTARMVNEKRLRLMRPDAILINTGRGGLVDEDALARALHEGWIAGAAVDVLDSEPPRPDCPLLTAPRIMVTPHIAWATHEACDRLMDIAIGNLAAYLASAPVNTV